MLQVGTNGRHLSITLFSKHMFPKCNKNYHRKHQNRCKSPTILPYPPPPNMPTHKIIEQGEATFRNFRKCNQEFRLFVCFFSFSFFSIQMSTPFVALGNNYICIGNKKKVSQRFSYPSQTQLIINNKFKLLCNGSSEASMH